MLRRTSRGPTPLPEGKGESIEAPRAAEIAQQARLGTHLRGRRAGFTLLEILLASLLAAMLLAALYAAMHTTLQQTQMTRDAVESEDLSRGVFNKITIDLSGTLAPLPPKSGGNSASAGAASNASAAPASSAGAGAAPATTAAPTADASGTGATDTTNTTLTAAPLFQGGVVGQDQLLVLFLSRVPETFGRYGETGQVRADQRQVVYKFVDGRGLYRVERPWVTADNLTMDLDPDAPDAVLIADEVVSLQFEYCDGSSWASTWDGTVPGPDGVTPLGPPRAVKVTMTLSIPSGKGEPLSKQVSQIIVIRSAPGTYTPPLLEAPTDGAANTTADPAASGSGSSTPAASGSGSSTPAASSGASKPTSSSGGSGASMPSTSSGTKPSVPSGVSLPSGSGGTTGGSSGTGAGSGAGSGTGGGKSSGSGASGGKTGGG